MASGGALGVKCDELILRPGYGLSQLEKRGFSGGEMPSRVVGEGGVPVAASQSLATRDFTCELIPDSFLSPKTVKIGGSKILRSGHLTRGRQDTQPAFSQDWD